MTKFCSACGAQQVLEEAKFCHQCGTSLKPSEDKGVNIEGDVSNSIVLSSSGDMTVNNPQITANSHNVSNSHNTSSTQTTTNSHNLTNSHNVSISISDAFKDVYEQIDGYEEILEEEREAVYGVVQDIEQEVSLGEQADENKVKPWLRKLANMAPDIFDVVVSTLISPTLGIAQAIGKIAVKAKEDYGTR